VNRMTLHLLKDPISPLTIRALSSLVFSQGAPPMVVLLSPGDIPSSLSKYTVYHMTENNASQKSNAISYNRLVAMLFEADRVISW